MQMRKVCDWPCMHQVHVHPSSKVPAMMNLKKVCDVEEIHFLQWKKDEGKNFPERLPDKKTGEEVYRMFINQLLDFKRHHYNSIRQHSEMQHLRQNLNDNEVIIQIGFSENNEKIIEKEIQSAYLGHKSFGIYKQHVFDGRNKQRSWISELLINVTSNHTD